ncbi:ankyrin repeat domain-containing protein [Pseudomonas carassii]|uniref:Ankyrin repeat domain-containing protein n=1 Tax=Pseudomonas carassii TaxID=3115855 RepID=A0ABU7HFV4_9PSED|nr:ankyrin repeat domain-containing protein [Pseudomonas sp. 137P]MEE1890005.1 ankyrin repeat domain-containing protein [Pseudomonas sp. 137P]
MSRQRFTSPLLAFALTALCVSASATQQEAPNLPKALYNAVGNYGFYKTPEYMAEIKQLLAQGAQPAAVTMMAAVSSRQPEVLDLLIAKVDDINAPVSSNGETLLTYTLSHISPDGDPQTDVRMVKSLIKAGADVNAIVRARTASPLQIAAAGDGSRTPPQPQMVKLLLDAGADAKATLGNDFNPLTGRAATSLEVIKLLVDAGTNPYQVTKPGSTPLHFVCERNFALQDQPDPQAAQRIAILLKKGSSPDEIHPQSGAVPVGTPLLEAARSHNPDCVAALIAAGADPDAPAHSPTYLKNFPDTEQKTVRQQVLAFSEKFDGLYSPEVVKLFQ